MMNVFAIAIVLTSLLTATVWSPSPTQHKDQREVIVKDGHRVVVVEYDKEADGSTKVLISPPDVVSTGTDSKETEKKPADGFFSGPRELVCDAYGKCKHKIADALGKTRDKVEEKAHGAYDKAQEIEEQAKETVTDAKEKLSEKVTGKKIGESLSKAKESVAEGIGKAKKVGGDMVDTVKDGADKVKSFDVVDSPKRMGEDIQRNVTGKVEGRVKETVENVQDAGGKTLAEISRKLKDVAYDVVWYVLSRDKIDAVAGLIHMLGFSTAYGMCVWVTFVSSYILGRYLPKQQFAVVQSRIYPVYFKAIGYCVFAALLGHLGSRSKNEIISGVKEFPGSSLVSALLMVLSNMILLEPRATKVMYERMKIEKEEGRGVTGPTKERVVEYGVSTTPLERPPPAVEVGVERQDHVERVLMLNGKLKRLNMYSSLLNVSTLVALTWHMVYMSRQLQAAGRR